MTDSSPSRRSFGLGRITARVVTEPEETALTRLRTAEATVRSLGSDAFLRHASCSAACVTEPGRKVEALESAGDLFAGQDDRPTQSGNV
jgi:hypothetical protein